MDMNARTSWVFGNPETDVTEDDDDLMAERQQAKAEGIIAGRAEGRAEGEARLAKLMTLLCDKGRIGDVGKVSVDAEFREKCYKEFNL